MLIEERAIIPTGNGTNISAIEMEGGENMKTNERDGRGHKGRSCLIKLSTWILSLEHDSTDEQYWL